MKPVTLFGGALARRPLDVLEKDVLMSCDDLVRKMGGTVVRTNPPHRMKQDFGVPDRRYRMLRTAFYFEGKKPAKESKLSRAQYDFLIDELNHNCLAACGVLEDLVELINAIRGGGTPDVALSVCRRIIERWAARGFRDEPKRRTLTGARA